MDKYETLELLIDGAWMRGTGTRAEEVTNPSTGDIIGELQHASRQDIDDALAASRNGFATWRATAPIERQRIMENAARLMEERKETIARVCTMEVGKPLAESRIEMDFVIGVTRWYGEEGKRAYGRIVPARNTRARNLILREPVGPVAAFVAWNFPGTNVIRKVAGALGAGCSIVIKASEETPGTCIAIARCFHDAGLPPGVLNLVFGIPDEVSRQMLASPIPRKLSFTGSVPVGKHLQKLAADTLKRCTLELGGHAPVVVCEDADLEKAAAVSAAFKFRNAGQVCISPSRFYVQEKVYDQFVDLFAKHARAIRVGDGLDEQTQMGPLVAARRVEVMERFVADACEKGAEIVYGGNRQGNAGHFFQPTVLKNVPPNARLMNEEPFGPVAPFAPFHDLEEAVTEANRLPVGLASYVFTSNANNASTLVDQIDAGMVGINHTAISLPETPFGGVDESGYGSEGGIEGLEAYQRVKFASEIFE